ncbi:helix-turn-helix transcriptional regulator [Halomonas sp. CKK8]|uniref:S24 family peptidase n=1 Tax=Halomonas sp. CKK8 TaxID=3036127 RepID=UPI00241529D4|nr:helix-turn-helix transcriptional regulator [Halomonas sp. CKK8]WFM72929.1 helix-turn-helix transcriptional regulator [Halomonas sp. CKK8]
MKISDRRRENLRQLLEERFQGKKASLAHAIEREPSYISRCLSDKAHRKNIGEDFARHIERSLGLSEGWMDKAPREPAGGADPKKVVAGPIGAATGAAHPRRDDMVLHDTEIVEDDGPLRPDEVELPCFREVEFSAGDGRSQVIENHGHTMRFSLPKLSRAGVQPENGACATASGSSMEPTIADGSPIAIDKGCRHVIDGKIYALDHGGMLRVKRLYKLPLGKVRLVSDNADEYPEEICSLMGEDAPRIIGRVFWWEVFD